MKKTENDYIAEYIKEKHPELLGLDFALWKIGRMLCEAMAPIVEAIKEVVGAFYQGFEKGFTLPEDEEGGTTNENKIT